MSWDFNVPVSVEDLLKAGGVDQYVVQDVLTPKELPSHLNSKHTLLQVYVVILCWNSVDVTFPYVG